MVNAGFNCWRQNKKMGREWSWQREWCGGMNYQEIKQEESRLSANCYSQLKFVWITLLAIQFSTRNDSHPIFCRNITSFCQISLKQCSFESSIFPYSLFFLRNLIPLLWWFNLQIYFYLLSYGSNWNYKTEFRS